MALGKLVSTQKKSSSIVHLIKEKLVEERLVPPMTTESCIRASSMYRMCPREEVLASLLNVTRAEKLNADSMLTFQHGHGLHHQLQNDILPFLKVLVGRWECQKCLKTYGYWDHKVPPELTLRPKPEKCDNCGEDRFVYDEFFFKDEQLRIEGHSDGLLLVPGRPGIGVFEGKSISERGAYDVRSAPKVDHIVQVHVYMHLTGLKWGKILYWNKGKHGLQALIEHDVERDDELIKIIVDGVKSIRKGIRTNSLPDRICGSPTCNRAKVCYFAKECFALNSKLPENDLGQAPTRRYL